MRIIKSIKALRTQINRLRKQNKTIGFIPTMGALHQGHASLIRHSKKESDISVLSIFVNPTQFGPKEDFAKYPRRFKKDKLLAKKEKVDIIFYPSADEIYPSGYSTHVEIKELGDILCGKSRPGHFKGVTTVVAKLLNLVCPDHLYLGQKDAQQAVIIKKMVSDLNFPVNVHTCPTVRETDGLAMSSRNVYLSTQERREAPILFKSLKYAKKRILSGEKNARRIIDGIRLNITNHSSGMVDYIECVDADNLSFLKTLKGKILIALAAQFGKTRLIDNIIVQAK